MARPSKSQGKEKKPYGNIATVNPRTPNQALAIEHFKSKTLTILEGLAGTGKTYLAVHYALSQFMTNKVSKVILTRPLMNVGSEKLGFLPGEVNDKVRPYAEQFNEYMNEFMPMLQFSDERKLEAGIEFIPLAYIRGRNFEDTIVIADEMQNSTPLQMKTLLTRAGEGTKLLVLGDTKQSDAANAGIGNGLTDLTSKLGPDLIPSIGKVVFTSEDIQRSGFVRNILELYGDI